MTKTPSAQWAQRDEKAYITFRVCDCKDATVEFKEKSVNFSGTANKECYASTLELFDEIDSENSTWVKEGRGVFCTLQKKTKAYWPRLLKEKTKQHWLSVDFQRWKDEDDSSDGEGEQAGAGGEPDFMQMMNQMGKGGDGGMPSMDGIGDDDDSEDDEVDSDDEDIPTLEENNAGDAASQ